MSVHHWVSLGSVLAAFPLLVPIPNGVGPAPVAESMVECDSTILTCVTECTHKACKGQPGTRCLDEADAECVRCCHPPTPKAEPAAESIVLVTCEVTGNENGTKSWTGYAADAKTDGKRVCELALKDAGGGTCSVCTEASVAAAATWCCGGTITCEIHKSEPTRTCSWTDACREGNNAKAAKNTLRSECVEQLERDYPKPGYSWSCDLGDLVCQKQ